MPPGAPYCRGGPCCRKRHIAGREGRSMKSALEGISAVATSREEAEWGCFSQVATGFRPHRAFRVSRPPEDKDAASLAMLPEKARMRCCHPDGKWISRSRAARQADEFHSIFLRSRRKSFLLFYICRNGKNSMRVIEETGIKKTIRLKMGSYK